MHKKYIKWQRMADMNRNRGNSNKHEREKRKFVNEES